MAFNPGMFFWGIIVGLWLWGLPSVQAGEPVSTGEPVSNSTAQVYDLKRKKSEPVAAVLNQLVTADVVYLGETHDRPADHQAQLEIVRSLQARRPLIIGMEMFQRPFQWVLDQYIAGRLSETDSLRLTEYPSRWRYDWELYAPILRFARDHHVPVLALNTPSEVLRKVARQGLQSLTLAERQWLPPRSAIRTEPDAYRQRLRQLYDEMHQGQGNHGNFDRFFLAQVVWDETMAERVAIALRRYPDALIVVLAGQGHVMYGHGIPQRVARRIPAHQGRPLRQITVLLNPEADLVAEPEIADFFWSSPTGN